MSSTAASYWRTAGLKYLQREFIAAKAVRSALKPGAVKPEHLKLRNDVYHKIRKYEKGIAGDRIDVETLL